MAVCLRPPPRLALDDALRDPPATRPRLLVVTNPHATAVSERRREVVLHALAHRFRVEAVQTEHRGHATDLARRAVDDGMDLVVAFGGDGTVNEIAGALAGTTTPLSVLPGGSANVFARLIGMPGDVIDATQQLLRLADGWRPRPVALGRVGERWFAFTCGFGLDADVVARVDAHPGRKKRFGPWYFAACAAGTFAGRYATRPPRLVVEGAGAPVEGATAILQNAGSYTYFHARPVILTPGPRHEDAELRGLVLRRTTPTVMPGIALRAVVPGLDVGGHRAVARLPAAAELTVRTLDDRPLPLQVDGDRVGEVQAASVRAVAGAMHVVS